MACKLSKKARRARSRKRHTEPSEAERIEARRLVEEWMPPAVPSMPMAMRDALFLDDVDPSGGQVHNVERWRDQPRPRYLR